ncbi:MAG: exodeoxyribonuclease VII large subunit [Dehalococcoidia bacterium]
MQPVTVGALVFLLRDILEGSEYLSDLWVVGEVSNYTESRLGHRYFSLKDDTGLIRCVLFRDDMPGESLEVGERVLVHGRVSVYPQRGELQFVCDFVRPEGVGILAARFEQLRQRLDAEGLFDPARKRALPRFPLRIGVVTSPTGAAIRDIEDVLARRWPLATLVFAPASVQGDRAAPEIVAALRRLAGEPGLDVAILARGGGSAEDLWAFNDEAVARAVFAFPVPLVTGVGHETDVTIVDFVADRRAPTPSAAAEQVTPDIAEVASTILTFDRMMHSAARSHLAEAAGQLERTATRLERAAPRPGAIARELLQVEQRMASAIARQQAAGRARLEHVAARVEALNPRATLQRGYAIVQGAKHRRVISRVRQVRPGDRLTVAVTDGAFWTEVS